MSDGNNVTVGRITFTPGPWRVRSKSLGVVGRPNVGGFDVVAHVAQRSNIEADGRLIAAAPDLLSVLKALVDAAIESTAGLQLEHVLAEARAVIAKAEGSTHGD